MAHNSLLLWCWQRLTVALRASFQPEVFPLAASLKSGRRDLNPHPRVPSSSLYQVKLRPEGWLGCYHFALLGIHQGEESKPRIPSPFRPPRVRQSKFQCRGRKTMPRVLITPDILSTFHRAVKKLPHKAKVRLLSGAQGYAAELLPWENGAVSRSSFP